MRAYTERCFFIEFKTKEKYNVFSANIVQEKNGNYEATSSA